ncbi:hypothetical protein K2X33_15485 [bacterium]|nr:hypothetical protein [bacterium]
MRLWQIAVATALISGGLVYGATRDSVPPPFDVRSVSPPTARDVGDAMRETMHIPARVDPPDRLFMFETGFGIPSLPAISASFQILRRWQVGASYGIVPGLAQIIPHVPLPEVQYTLPDNNNYALNPVLSTRSVDSICPFIRYFPTHRTTYLQLTWALVRTDHMVSSGLRSVALNMEIPNSKILAFTTLTHTIPTLSIGHIFWRHLFFLNINIGASFVLSTTSSTRVTTSIPDPLGSIVNSDPNTFRPYAQQMDQQINANADVIKNAIGIIPSIQLTGGLMF